MLVKPAAEGRIADRVHAVRNRNAGQDGTAIEHTGAIAVRLLGSVTYSSELQDSNAQEPMLVTPSGMLMPVRLLQFSKAETPMLVILFGISMLVSPMQSLNA